MQDYFLGYNYYYIVHISLLLICFFGEIKYVIANHNIIINNELFKSV